MKESIFMGYELGWDVNESRCVVDAMGNWVTNIPADMSFDEVIRRLENRSMKVFDVVIRECKIVWLLWLILVKKISCS